MDSNCRDSKNNLIFAAIYIRGLLSTEPKQFTEKKVSDFIFSVTSHNNSIDDIVVSE